jgi:hypothetical protein
MAAETATNKPPWQRFFESTGGTALITVLLGGVLGNWIAGGYEERRALNERRYLTHQEYLEERLATIRPTLERVGQTVAAAEDLITITRPDFDPRRYAEGQDRDDTLAKRKQIREDYNDADVMWRREKAKLGYLLAYYHPGSAEVSAAWREFDDAVTSFVDCARSWWIANAGKPTEAAACEEDRAAIDQTMGNLIETLDVSPTTGATQ